MQTEIMTLPVYRLSREKYYAERSGYIERTMYGGPEEHVSFQKEFHKRNPNIKFQYEDYLNDKYGGCWEFNEIEVLSICTF